MLIDRQNSMLLVIDMQERLLPAMAEPERALRGCVNLLTAARRFNLPVVASEQYPKGLGPTVPEVAALVPGDGPMAKVHFSCLGDDAIRASLDAAGVDQVMIGGVECHVCVQMTALGLRQAGKSVFVVADAVSSRRRDSVDLALDRMRGAGVEVVDSEMVLFEWLGQAGTEDFKFISKLVR